ncbi:MAG: hypothetical protein ACXV5H_06555 [Halobacteriota archaeon]
MTEITRKTQTHVPYGKDVFVHLIGDIGRGISDLDDLETAIIHEVEQNAKSVPMLTEALGESKSRIYWKVCRLASYGILRQITIAPKFVVYVLNDEGND